MSSTIDNRSLLNMTQAAELLGWVHARPRGGSRLHAFVATMYYAWPEEVVALDVVGARLPADDADDRWGELPMSSGEHGGGLGRRRSAPTTSTHRWSEGCTTSGTPV